VTWEEKWERLRKFVWKNLDALFVVVVAFGILVVEVIGKPARDVVDSAILALLGVTAIVMLRDRIGRDELEELSQIASDALTDLPYAIVWQVHEWDIRSRDQTVAQVKERLRFTRNSVSTISDWSSGAGKVEAYRGKWRRSEGDVWIDAEMIHTFPIDNGEKVLHCLDEEHSRGDMLDWWIEWDSLGRFPKPHESVSVEARAKSDHPRVLRIKWPADARPSHVEVRSDGRPARPLAIGEKDGRPFVEEKVANLPVGDYVKIAWNW